MLRIGWTDIIFCRAVWRGSDYRHLESLEIYYLTPNIPGGASRKGTSEFQHCNSRNNGGPQANICAMQERRQSRCFGYQLNPTPLSFVGYFADCFQKPALVTYVTAGYPTADGTVDILLGMEAGGAGNICSSNS